MLSSCSDYATYLNAKANVTSTDPVYDYKMVGISILALEKRMLTSRQVDSDYYLPVLMKKYFIDNEIGRKRAGAFLKYVLTSPLASRI